MKKCMFPLLFLLFTITSYGQGNEPENEFGTSSNGLIYSDATMNRLKYIVDSLNLKFKVCEQRSLYRSFDQGKGRYFELHGSEAGNAVDDLDYGLGFKEVKQLYDKATTTEELYILRKNDKDYDDNSVVDFSVIALQDASGIGFRLPGTLQQFSAPSKGKWIYKFDKGGEGEEQSLRAFYITEDFEAREIPDTYARMIQYSDCLIDTTQRIFRKTYRQYFDEKETSDTGQNPAADFDAYVEESVDMPKFDQRYYDSTREQYLEKRKAWDQLYAHRIDSLARLPEFLSRLSNAADAVMANKNGYETSDQFEDFVSRYYSKNAALEMKRRRIVVGGCSMDQSPRYHALAIATLSAETTHWEIFLRAHLDIMNDRFERVSDGSYAWAERKTYIKELELLDINVEDLLLGISLNYQDAHPNHYFGNFGRLGRAIAETNDKAGFEKKMLTMISDKNLDMENRAGIYFLFLVYNHNLEDKVRKIQNKSKLEIALKTFPESMQTGAVLGFEKD